MSFIEFYHAPNQAEQIKSGRSLKQALFYAIGRTKDFDLFTNMVITDKDVELSVTGLLTLIL